MSLGRRKVGIDDPSRWVFNRMADLYEARPPYPPPLVEALADLAGSPSDGRGRVVDLGAGIGHLTLPLAARGLELWAVEPARLMLDRLQAAALVGGLPVRSCHATAENLPLQDGSIDLAIIADALHFLDAQLTAEEISRVLVRNGSLAVMTCEFAATPFMRDVVAVMHDAVPRRPRALGKQLVHISAITRIPLTQELRFEDQIPVDHATLERILQSISFIGPAMNPQRFAAFRTRVHALSDAPVWGRSFVLRWGRR